MRIDQIKSNPIYNAPLTPAPQAGQKTEGKAFIDLLEGMDTTQNGAQKAVYDLLVNGKGDAHEVLIQQKKAESQMKTAAVIRDNLIEGYKQLLNTQL
ncbi:flagellar hook-basal body complex protein FliE [Ectobacillus ponti]|uniref:Flagellar hook-basal body complex protein FliE n=1 Tax=Ectobacillus ponti TaxID=2961894 RepID=A0AA41X9M8_9BACI|nr:flagellar hook-basal body complex protein FliE [Ectobacillus ponti]MCP8968843.1 flagellar hook-basal body complex protein FliE [Ectobacillus ponti]